jgi:hypothetical protein
MQATNKQTVPVLVVRTHGFLTMSCNYKGQAYMTECDTREQGIDELSQATGLPAQCFYLTEAE